MKRTYLLCILLMTFLSTTSFAYKNSFGLGAGAASFENKFKSAAIFGFDWGVEQRSGLGYHFTVQFLQSQSKKGEISDVTLIPYTAELHYSFFRGKQIRPYIGAGATLMSYNKDFKSPRLGSVIRAGVKWKVARHNRLYFEAQKFYIPDTEVKNINSDINISPFIVKAGLLHTWGNRYPERVIKKRPGTQKRIIKKRRIKKVIVIKDKRKRRQKQKKIIIRQ